MTYDQLSINQKIELKGELRQWATYAIDHFQQDLDKKVYGLRSSKKGVQRTALRRNYTFGSGKGLKRTYNLRKNWYQTVQEGSGVDRVMIQFLQYGRFLDMGVGRGTSHTGRVVNRQLGLGATGRTRKAWYSKRKAYETHVLREILANRNINIALGTVENLLNNLSVTATI